MENLEGRTVVITGAASGIGRAFAQGFRSDGAEVVGCDIDESGLAALAGLGIHTSVADVSDDDAVRGVIDLALERTGRVDVLFNNAGMGNRTAVEDLAPGEFERMLAVHLFGCIYGMRAAIPVMRAQGYGRIVNIISRAAESPAGNNAAYGAAKAGIWVASRSAAAETAGSGILVNMLFPGMTNTGIWGRDMPGMQDPADVYPSARVVATLPADGPSGTVFYRGEPYAMFDQANNERLQSDRAEVRRRRGDG
jgi:NAD(P)-dependent dehydrogenase (short-subunit alcohol dehydrogenase family)